MRQTVALALFLAGIVFFARNLYEMEQISALAARVQRRLHQLAVELQEVVALNYEVKSLLGSNSDVEIEEAPKESPFDDLFGSRRRPNS